MTTIYHGTPLTPRAALNAIMPGRAACISFYRPDDLEALLAICPQLMFRPRGVQLLDGGDARREGMGSCRSRRMVAGLLSMARTYHLPSRSMGYHSRQSGRTDTDQRWPVERLAIWPIEGRTGLAHGWANREACSPLRAIRSCLPRMDWRPEERAGRVRRLPFEDGRSIEADGQCLAPAAHASGDSCCIPVPLHRSRRDNTRAERAPIFDRHEATRHLGRTADRSVGRPSGICGQTGGQAS